MFDAINKNVAASCVSCGYARTAQTLRQTAGLSWLLSPLQESLTVILVMKSAGEVEFCSPVINLFSVSHNRQKKTRLPPTHVKSTPRHQKSEMCLRRKSRRFVAAKCVIVLQKMPNSRSQHSETEGIDNSEMLEIQESHIILR